MPRKSSQRKTEKSSKKNYFYGNFIFFLQIALVLIIFLVAYIFWLEHRVRTEFEGKRWSIPARVYAQPKELYVGKKINIEELNQELKVLGYRRASPVVGMGEYQVTDNKVILQSRPFEFWDGVETSKLIDIQVVNEKIQYIRDKTKRSEISILRLEPQLIGKIYPAHNEDRILVSYNEVPELLINALISVEDKNFFNHYGIDLKGILRAIWTNIRSGSLRQGGSSLTQQLVKNYFLNQERTFWRKFNELIMTLLLEYYYSKEEILEAYINEVYLGQLGSHSIHGFGTASEYYFARPLRELNLEQLALLVAIVKGASFYNPRKHPNRALERRNLVIDKMLEQQYINEAEALHAKKSSMQISVRPEWSSAKYPAFLDVVRVQLLHDYDINELRNEGLRIFTTLDPAIQAQSASLLKERILLLEKQRNLPKGKIEGAVIIADRNTGEILSVVGGREEKWNEFNRAINASRPIGSLIKPAIYLAALSQPDKFNVITSLDDKQIKIKLADGTYWTPKNYDGKIHGNVPLYHALSKSLNLATVDLGFKIGFRQVKKTLRDLGVNQDIPEYPSLFLGALNLTPLEVAQMYQIIANDGFKIPLKSIREVLDQNGNPLNRYDLEMNRTINSKYVYLIKYLLTRVINEGTASLIRKKLFDKLPLAGKTGTTNDLRDSWFAGYGGNIVAVVWLGRDDNKPAGLTGASGALTVWSELMQKVNILPLNMMPPEGIEFINILQGKRVIGNCQQAVTYPFIIPYGPSESIRCDNRETINSYFQ